MEENTRPPRRTRFSLLTLVLLTTIVALAVTVALLYRELAPLRTEVRQLRKETGQLLIDDPSKLHVIGVETYNDWAWKWRLWVPAGRTIRFGFAAQEIPKQGEFPSPRALNVPPKPEGREMLVTARIETKPDGALRLALSSEGVTTYLAISDAHAKWLLEGERSSTGGAVFKSTRVVPPNEPFDLLRKRVFYDSPTGQIPPNPQPATTDGVLVWLEVDAQ